MRIPSFVDSLGQLVASPSVSSTQASLDQSNFGVVTLLAGWFEGLGFKSRVYEVSPNTGKYNLLAHIGPSTSGGIVFSGHTDTVPFNAERWQTDPFELCKGEEGYRGLGATDMKGFFPIVLQALAHLDLSKLLAPITVVATADEECSMIGAASLVDTDIPQDAWVIIGEPTGLAPIRLHKGILMEKITIRGRSGHSSNPNLGSNAIDALQQVLASLSKYRGVLTSQHVHNGFAIPTPTLNFGCVHGGDNPNRICGGVELEFDVRPVPGLSIAQIRQHIDQLLPEISKRTDTLVTRSSLFNGVEAFEQSADCDLVREVETLLQRSSESVAYATEAPFFQALGRPTLVLGAGSIDQAHQANEFIPYAHLLPAQDMYRQLIVRRCMR